jgi:hypothetical protein
LQHTAEVSWRRSPADHSAIDPLVSCGAWPISVQKSNPGAKVMKHFDAVAIYSVL